MREIHGLAGKMYASNREEIESALKRIFKMHDMAKQEGLLSLEVSAEIQEEFYTGKHFLVRAITSLCDGLSLEKQKELMTNRILAETDLKKQFICLLYKCGVELIAAGEHWYYVKTYLSSLFPEECEEAVSVYMEKLIQQQNEKIKEEKQRVIPEKFQEAAMPLPYEVSEEIKQLEALLLGKEDTQVLDMLRNTDNYDVCSFLMGATVFGREKILKNMSGRLRLLVMEDVVERCEQLAGHYEEELENVKAAIFKIRNNL